MSAASPSRWARGLGIGVTVLVILPMLDGVMGRLLAEMPFGGPRSAIASPVGGLAGWILARQSEFYRARSRL